MPNYYIGDVSGTDEDANQFWFRYAQPFSLGDSKWLLRGSLPINTYPVAPTGGHKTGLGDLNLLVQITNFRSWHEANLTLRYTSIWQARFIWLIIRRHNADRPC